MDWQWVLTSFEGRLGREQFWIAAASALCFIAACFAVDAVFLRGASRFVLFVGLLHLAIAVVAALATKRLHDRDKSAHWMWFFVGVPYVVGVTGLILSERSPTVSLAAYTISTAIVAWLSYEVGFLRGTVGPNRFGPDPQDVAEAQRLGKL